ncbi:MAG: hypothetical protein KBD00_04475 [Candidatus Peribacteraceae bacterium]|nr:hypothetical protein [Candidatus Peribacteraceae bacterium]
MIKPNESPAEPHSLPPVLSPEGEKIPNTGNDHDRMVNLLSDKRAPIAEYPAELQSLISAIRNLSKKEYLVLIGILRTLMSKKSPAIDMATISPAIKTLIMDLAPFVDLQSFKESQINSYVELFRLTRTDLPDYGVNIFNPADKEGVESDSDVALQLRIILEMPGSKHVMIKIIPSGNVSKVECWRLGEKFSTCDLVEGQAIILGRSHLNLDQIFGKKIPSTKIDIDLQITKNIDDWMSRACMRITRKGGKIIVEECGISLLKSLRFEVFNPREKDKKVAAGTFLPSVSDDGMFGMTERDAD